MLFLLMRSLLVSDEVIAHLLAAPWGRRVIFIANPRALGEDAISTIVAGRDKNFHAQKQPLCAI